MKIYKGTYKNLSGIFLENKILRVCILPELGAKIASIYYKPQDYEVLFQPVKNEYSIPKYGDDFSLYDTSGADEMFPTIDKCIYPYDGYKGTPCPDHGELWSKSWDIEIDGDVVKTYTTGIRFPYRIERGISLSESGIDFNYTIENNGNFPLYGIWAFHALANCDEKTRIILPGVEEVVNVNKTSRYLGEIDRIHKFPQSIDSSGNTLFLDNLRPQTANNCEKYYVNGRGILNEAGMTQNRGKLIHRVFFDPEKVPYLGVWINEGGFKGGYNLALEPSTGFYDSLEITKEKDGLEPIEAGEELEFWMRLEFEGV